MTLASLVLRWRRENLRGLFKFHDQVRAERGNRCEQCGSGQELDIHYLVPDGMNRTWLKRVFSTRFGSR
jgi:hypothetical protein